ncbi:MAG: DNA cytosine methyltransferase, partial [Staphylococcus equorum]|nr:DNA cytosine methyltransferase [Staphylococcus equorum]
PYNKIEDIINISQFNLEDKLIKYEIEGELFIDVRDINSLIVNRGIKYKFSKINTEQNTREFCEDRNIISNGYNVIDLFCGAGGSSSGFRLAGFNIVGAMDINKAAVNTHELNFRTCKTVLGDIAEISPAEFSEILDGVDVDVIIGSPPCQTFSSLSQGKIRSLGQDIKKDIRNYYYKNFLDYISFFKPKMFLMENVPGFMTRYGGLLFEDLLNYIEKNHPEYNLKYDILDASDYSVPQSRKRLFICGYLKGINFTFPTKNLHFMNEGHHKVSVGEAIGDLPFIQDNWRLDRLPYSRNNRLSPYQKFMRTGSDLITNNICRISNDEAKVMFSLLSPGQRYIDLPDEKKAKVKLFETFNSSVIEGRCRRLPINDVSWTIIAHIGMDGYEYIHPTECRTISVREAARLQSFTDDFVFSGNMREQYVQVGNAVPPLLSYSIATSIRESLDKYIK